MDGAVLVVSDTFMSRVEKLDGSCEKGEDSGPGLAVDDSDAGGDDWNGDGER